MDGRVTMKKSPDTFMGKGESIVVGEVLSLEIGHRDCPRHKLSFCLDYSPNSPFPQTSSDPSPKWSRKMDSKLEESAERGH